MVNRLRRFSVRRCRPWRTLILCRLGFPTTEGICPTAWTGLGFDRLSFVLRDVSYPVPLQPTRCTGNNPDTRTAHDTPSFGSLSPATLTQLHSYCGNTARHEREYRSRSSGLLSIAGNKVIWHGFWKAPESMTDPNGPGSDGYSILRMSDPDKRLDFVEPTSHT